LRNAADDLGRRPDIVNESSILPIDKTASSTSLLLRAACNAAFARGGSLRRVNRFSGSALASAAH
jgi:hypothetical protein